MKVHKILERADGSQVLITAQACFGVGLTRSVDVFVHHRASTCAPWTLANDRPSPRWKSMSRQDYELSGRSEMLRLAKPGEILKVTSTLPLA